VEAHGFSRAKKIAERGGFSRCGKFRWAQVFAHVEMPQRLKPASIGTAEAVPFHETLPGEDV
jgi:hypothetical protein